MAARNEGDGVAAVLAQRAIVAAMMRIMGGRGRPRTVLVQAQRDMRAEQRLERAERRDRLAGVRRHARRGGRAELDDQREGGEPGDERRAKPRQAATSRR